MLQWLTDGEPTVAVLEFVTVGTDHTAFLSGSVKGGGRLEGTFGKPTTHYKLRITLKNNQGLVPQTYDLSSFYTSVLDFIRIMS